MGSYRDFQILLAAEKTLHLLLSVGLKKKAASELVSFSLNTELSKEKKYVKL